MTYAKKIEKDGIWYNIYDYFDFAEVTFGTSKYFGAITIPSTIENEGRTYSVTSIGDNAFADCPNLISVKIPNCITTIGHQSFSGCEKLENVEIPNSVEIIGALSFSNCSGIKKIEIPNSVKTIGDGTFSGCKELTSIILSESITRISNSMFSDCASLGSITIPDDVVSIAGYAFKNCVQLSEISIPNNVTSIDFQAFDGCTSLSSIIIPKNVINIGPDPFSGCSNLVSVVFEDGDKDLNVSNTLFPASPIKEVYLGRNITYKVPHSPFNGMKTLESLTIGKEVTSIQANEFSGCDNLTSLVIPNNVKRVDTSAISAYLTSLIIEDGNTPLVMNSDALNSYSLQTLYLGRDISCYNSNYEPFRNSVALIEVTMGDNVTSINKRAFYDCKELTTFNIGKNVTSIGEEAFGNCSKMSSLYIPASVVTIGSGAFYGCDQLNMIKIEDLETWCNISDPVNGISNRPQSYKLFIKDEEIKDLYIPQSVKIISKDAFNGCTSITSVIIPEGVEIMENEVFVGCENLTKVVIPSTMNSWGHSVFYRCTNLTDVYCYMNNIVPTSSNMFAKTNVENGTLHVPQNVIDDYKATSVWNSFGSIVGLQENDTHVEDINNITNPFMWYSLDGTRTMEKPTRRGIYIQEEKGGTRTKVLLH